MVCDDVYVSSRMLYIIGSYTKPSLADQDKSEWIRRNALIVLIYEAIVGGDPDNRKPPVLEYDYAPSSQLIEGRRVWLNVPHEGISDVDYLCEEGLVQVLKMASDLHSSITAYQVTSKGQQIVDRLSKTDKGPVNELVYAPGTKHLMMVTWEMDETVTDGTGGTFHLVDQTSAGGYEYQSSITETEDVSYVSSAYIPLCLRQGGRPTLSNAHRAHESAAGETQIKDVLDEVITLNSVSVIVSEFMPYGANNMVTTNDNLGSQQRVQGGLFTPSVETDKVATKLYIKPGMTKVDILDYSLSNHVNFEAEINEPEDGGIVQIEQFGISLNASGACFYGMQIEAVQDRIRDGISLDQLSRVLVDVQSDSSVVVDTIITKHQLDLEKLIFRDDEENRSKVKLIVANEIVPHLLAEEYMDKGEYENELRQVIGDTKTAYDISEHDVLIFGEEGLMLVGPNSRHHEPLLCSFLEVMNIDIYTRTFYQRLFFEVDLVRQMKSRVFNADSDPDTVPRTRREMAAASVHLTMLEEVLGYMQEALEHVHIPPEPPESTGRQLYTRLDIPRMKEELSVRVRDLQKIMKGAWEEFQILREVTNNARDQIWFRLNEQIQDNTKMMCELQEYNQKGMNALEMMQLSLGGLLAFATLDRVTGEWTVMDTKWASSLANFITGSPAWLFVSLFTWVGFTAFCLLSLRRSANQAKGTIAIRLKIHQKIILSNLHDYISKKNLDDEGHRVLDGNHVVKVTWTETEASNWGGFAPIVEIEFDAHTSYMLLCTIKYNRKQAKKYLAFNSEELKAQLFEDMHKSKVFEDTKYIPAAQDVQAGI
jgi:WD repeat-containing protein 35